MTERRFDTRPQSTERGWLQRKSSLRVAAFDDAYEREADRAADTVMSGRSLPHQGFSLSRIPVSHVQREDDAKPKSEEDKYKEAAEKIGAAFLETEIGKKLKEKAEQDPLVKGVKEAGESFIGTLPGKVITGAAAVGAVAALAATHKALPAQLPEIPLDKLTPGLKLRITYEGPVDNPSKAMITFSYTEQAAPSKKPAKTRAEQQREENARMALDMAKFQAGLRYAPGTPEAKRQQEEEAALKRAAFSGVGKLPGLGGPPTVFPALGQPAPALPLQFPKTDFGFKPKPFSLLDEELKLKPLDEAAPAADAEKKKKEPAAVQRKASHDAQPAVAPSIVSEVLSASGQALDPATRADMESRFGHDLSHVRVHQDTRANTAARSVHAAAYTLGANVVFDHGRYAPHTAQGRWLLAHELSHVIQQSDLSGAAQRAKGTGVIPAWSSQSQNADARSATPPQQSSPHYLQRAEHGTYVSKISNTGEPAYLDAGERFYRTWGHPNVRRVSTMQEIIGDLNKAKGPIDRFRIVSHGSSSGIEVGLLPEIAPEWFGKDAAEFTTKERFRKHFVDMRLVTESHFSDIYNALQKDATSAPLLTQLGATKTVPANDQPLGILLRAVVDERYLAEVQLDTGGKAAIANRDKLESFNNLRISNYQPLVLDALPKDKRTDAMKALTSLKTQIPKVMAAAKLSFATLTASEANDLADPFLDTAGKGSKLKPEISKSIKEGADGPYLKQLREVKTKVTDKTHIEIRGCNVGGSPATMDMVRGFFGTPGALPSLSAPDLFQFFFQLNIESYGRHPTEDTRLETAFTDAATGVAQSYEDLKRLRAGEVTRVVNESSLAQLAAKYGFDANKVRKLNPEIADPAKLKPGDLVWLVQRGEVAAGIHTKLGDFCRDYLGNEYAWPKVWAANPWLKVPDKLKPSDKLALPMDVLQPPIAAPAPTAAEFVKDVRGGKAVAAVDSNQNKPILHFDDPKRAKAVGDWLAAQKFDPQGRSGAALSKLYAGNAKQFMSARAGTYIQLLSRAYPNIEDPLFPEDPRYDKHIITRP